MGVKDVAAMLRWRARQQSALAWANYKEFDRYVYAADVLNTLADSLEEDHGRAV